jgi:hypothetical protein
MTHHQAHADLTIDRHARGRGPDSRTTEERSVDALEEIALQLKWINVWMKELARRVR